MDKEKGILWAVIIIIVVNVSAGLTLWILRDDPESAQEIIEQQGELAKKIYAITLDDSNDSSVIEGCSFVLNEPNEPNEIVITPADPNKQGPVVEPGMAACTNNICVMGGENEPNEPNL